MKNKKYNIYEDAHKMANQTFNWEKITENEDVQKNQIR